MIQNETVGIICDIARKRIAENKVNPYLLEVVERTIANSEGKTPERYELLKLWQKLKHMEEQK